MAFRIIVVEDEEDDREWCVDALESEGYQVFAPRNVDELLDLLQNVNPHCVLCDHYLDDDNWGYTGIQLAEDLGGTIPWVLMTKGPLDASPMARVWQPHKGRNAKLHGYYAKLDPIASLLELMHAVLEAYMPLNFALDILTQDLAQIIGLVAPDLVGVARSNQIDQLRENVNDLLRMLFRTYRGVYIKRQIYRGSGICLLHMGAERANGPSDNLLLLCGHRSSVAEMVHAFNDYGRANGLLNCIEERERLDVAGVVFAFGGDLAQVWPLSEIWLRRPVAQVRRLLEHLVSQRLAVWPVDGVEQVAGPEVLAMMRSLIDSPIEQLEPFAVEQRTRLLCLAAVQSLQLTYHSLEQRLELKDRDGRLRTYSHPLEALRWLDRLGAGWSAHCGAIYGAPHPDQILVDEPRAQLIFWDYRLVSEHAPHLLYFAQFDHALRVDALQQGSALDHYELELALLATEETDTSPAIAPAMQPVYQLIVAFRRTLRGLLGLADLRPYYAVLLLNTFATLRMDQPGNRVSDREIHAFLTAMLLADHLSSADVALRHPQGFFMDPQTGEVSIDGVKVEQERGQITPLDRRFLRYLYQRHDQLCTYADIICDVYERIEREALIQLPLTVRDELLKSEKPRIDATLNRLRAIIEPPENGSGLRLRRRAYQYLVTKNRVGIILRLRPTAKHA